MSTDPLVHAPILQECTPEPTQPKNASPLVECLTDGEVLYPLSPMQRGMLVESLGDQGLGANIEQIVLSLPEALDVSALARAWERVVARHAILRSRFLWERVAEPLQEVLPQVNVPLVQENWRSCVDTGSRLEAYLRGDRAAGFDLAQAPLMRLALFQQGDHDYRLVWTFHHILLDGRSFPMVLKEVFAFYEAFRQGRDLELAPPKPYREYIAWLQEQDFEPASRFWKSLLAGITAPTPLGIERSFGAAAQQGRGVRQIRVPEATTAALHAFAAAHAITVNTIVQGAWALLMHRYSGAEDVVFGATRACRHSTVPGADTMVGLFINTLPVRTRYNAEQPVHQWLQELRQQHLAVREYEHTPLNKIQVWSDVTPGMRLLDTLFVFENTTLKASLHRQIPGWGDRTAELHEQPLVPLAITVTLDTDLAIKIYYDRARFDDAAIARMLGHLQRLLEGIVADPQQKLSLLPLLTEPERHQLLVEVNHTHADYPRLCLHQLFEAQVQRTPDALALTCEQHTLTYRQLNARANQLAHGLILQGVGPEVRVGVCMERSVEMIVGMLGILKAGGAYLPLDPAYPNQRLAFMLKDSQTQIVLAQQGLVERLGGFERTCLCLDAQETHDQLAHQSQENPQSRVTLDNTAYIIYTSGSTGTPKGVLVAHHGLGNLAQAQANLLGIPPGSRILQFASQSFDASLFEIVMALASGGCLCLGSRESLLPNPNLENFLQRHQVQVVTLTPSALAAMSEQPLPHLQTILVAGEACPQELVERWAPGRRFFNLYGPSEATIWSSYAECFAGEAFPSIGVAISNTWLYVLDAQRQPVPLGVAGELYIGGVGLAEGYLKRPELTAQRFVANPFSAEAGSRLYQSGDVVRWSALGKLEYLGRVDDQVKVRGYRIELGEIESALREHAGVADAVVLAREDTPGQKQLVGYVVLETSTEVGSEELRLYLQGRLPAYLVPSLYVFVEAFPISANGKLDRKALPQPAAVSRVAEYVAARTPLEAGLCAIWSGLLGSKQVGIHDNFFALGGHSLLAMQVIARIRLTFQVEVPYQALFETPTIAGLAQRIAEARDETANPMPPLLPAARIQALPMSFAQQRLWFLDRYEPGNTTYNIPVALRLTGALDMDALQQSLNLLVQRHEALRTVFAVSEGEPIQIIQKFAPQDLPLTDLSSMGLVKRQEEARRLIRAEARRSFDLEHGPLFRTALLRLETEQHILLLTLHHIVSDGWSQDVLTKELTAAYNAFCSELPSPLPDLPIQYADYAAWQRNWLAGEELERLSAYWKEHLAGAPALLELPTDRPRPPLQTFEGALTRTTLPPELSQAVKQLGQREGSTLFMTLLAVFNILLARYSGQEDIVIGTPIANRTQTEVEGLIGFFVNTLAVRTQLSGDPNFIELLGRVREAALGAFAHQDLPFEKLVEELQPERSLSHSPIFQVVFALQNLPQSRWKLGALQVEEIPTAGATAKFDLSLFASESTGGLELELEYNTDLFDADRIERMLGHFQTLLQTIVANPNEKVSRLPLLTEAERQQLLVGWNQTAVDYPNFCIHQLFQQQAERTPEAIAAQFEHQQLTYRELNHRANQLAHFLHEQGIGPEQMVGLCVERSLDMLVGMLGILKAGAAYLPLDPNYPQERLAFLLEDTQAPLLITQKPLLDHFPDYEGKRFCLDTDGNTIFSFSQEAPVSNVTADNLAYLIYTSGSTGRPKGVAIAHASATRLLQWAATRYSPEELSGVLASTSLCFDLSVFEIFLPLSVGGKILLAPNALALPQMPARDQVTLINTVPSAIAELLNQGAIPPSVRTVNLAGEPLSTELADRLYAAGVGKVYDLYGPSEDTTYSTFTLRRAHAPATIGRPISNTQLYLLDARMQPVPVGVVGEIYLGGEGLARGYLNRAELTSERFVADPFGTPGGRLYRTGDLGKYFRDGNVGFLGRMDHQVKIRGFRIELGEIERRLREHERVAEAVVLAREDDPDQKRLVAYVVLREGGLGVGELRGHLGVTLPEYMIPSAFVFLEALPLTPNGKIDRKALPAPEMQHPEANYVAPRTPTEELLVGLWAELLKVQPIGIHDNFFDLGGHSLLATRVVARILSDLHIDIPMRTLFERPTIAGLVEAIEAANPTQSDHARTPLVPVTRDRALPLSFAQQRLWFIDQLESARTTYLVPLVLRLRGALHVETLRRVLETIVARHEVLRTLFPRLEGDPIQRIAAQAELRLSVFDLSKLPPAIRGPEADRRITEEARVPFSLADGPLIRCLLVRMDAEEHRLVVVMHHIITDGWSQGVFLQELTALYNAFSMDAPSPLPALPIQYADYAVWQREWLRGEALERQLSYWKEHLSGAPALLELPTDHPRPPVQTFQGASQHRKLSAQLTQQIKALAQREGSTLFMTLLSAFYVLLARYSGQEDIVVGTPIANRTRAEVEGLIGFFVNTLALRGDLSGDPSFRDLLDRVRRVALSAYAHQDLPFEKLVEELSPTRTLSYSPIFQAMFALQNMPNRNHAPGALQIEEMEIESVAAKFDLSLIATESASGLNLTLEYSTDLFQTDRMERMLAHFQNLLQSIVTEPQLPVSRLNLLSETERHQLLVEYNTPQIYFQPELCLHQLIQHQVAQTPEAIAVTFEDQHLTYQQLNARANQLAHYLIDQGVGPDRLVGLYVERSLEMVVGILGILKAGAAYLPLDPSYPQERIAYMLEDSQAALLLIQRSLQQNLTELPVPSFCLDTEAEILASYPTEDPETSVTPDNLAYVIYTSGSTGHPKGVLIPHYNVVRLLQATQHWFHFDVFDVWTLFHSHAFDFSVWEIFGALVYGGRLIVVPYLLSRSPEEFWELVVREGVTVLNQTPSAFYALMRAEEKSASSGSHDLRYVIFGGEALELGQLSGWLERHGEECPQLINMYGITETTVHVTYRRILKSDVEAGLGSLIGRSLPDLTLYVLDGALQPVPVGVRGELYVGGAGLARGYLKRPELTQERFIDNPFSTEAGSRLYKTGDVGCWHMDGTLEYLGRSDHQVKIRGFRIELGEIESRLREHESVREALVLAREDEPGHKRLVAYLVASEAGTAELSELRAFLKEELPEYMVPSGWVWLEAFPLTSNGKVDRKALPRPDSVQQDLGGEYVAPRTPREAKLAQVWAEVLRVERVGIFDNFFELGGDSILSLQIISRARQVGIPLRPTHIFQHQCIAELAEAATESAVIADQATVSGPVPSTPILRWFFERHLPDAGHFNQFALLEAREPVDAAILERVTAALINHHDMLRLRCLQTANGWDLSIAPEEAHPVFSRLDFSELSEAEQERRIDAEVARLHTSLDLTAGPLMRVALFDLGPDRPSVVAILIHHLCIDGVSWRILREDLEQGYRQALAGQSIALPEKTTSFPFWAERLAQRARSAALSEERDLWLSLASSPRMPLDFAQGPNTIASLRNVSVSLDEETTEVLLRRIPASHSVRLEEALITALAQTLTSWIGGDTLALHLEGHGREALFEDVDLSRTVGWFTSLFPVCLSLPSSASPEQQLGSVRDQLRAIPNRGVGYGMLRYLSEDEALMAQMAAVPEPEIGFNYLGQLEQGPDKGSLFAPRGASFSLSCSPRQSRARLLDLDCFILGGRLHMHWSFSENLHCQATIEQLAHAMLDALKRLAEADAAPMTQGYVDHDFPEMELSQESLDQILAELDL